MPVAGSLLRMTFPMDEILFEIVDQADPFIFSISENPDEVIFQVGEPDSAISFEIVEALGPGPGVANGTGYFPGGW